MTKIAAIQSNKTLQNMPYSWHDSDFKTVIRRGVEYKIITAFAHYFTTELIEQFDFVFDTQEAFEAWEKLPYLWHEPERPIRIFIEHEANSNLSIAFPEFAIFRKQMSIPSHIVDKGVCIYLNDFDGFEMGGEVIPAEQIRYILENRYNCVIDNL